MRVSASRVQRKPDVARQERVARLAASQLGAFVLEIILDSLSGPPAERHKPLFIAFAVTLAVAFLQVRVADGQVGQLGGPATGGV